LNKIKTKKKIGGLIIEIEGNKEIKGKKNQYSQTKGLFITRTSQGWKGYRDDSNTNLKAIVW